MTKKKDLSRKLKLEIGASNWVLSTLLVLAIILGTIKSSFLVELDHSSTRRRWPSVLKKILQELNCS